MSYMASRRYFGGRNVAAEPIITHQQAHGGYCIKASLVAWANHLIASHTIKARGGEVYTDAAVGDEEIRPIKDCRRLHAKETSNLESHY
jgi:hypothetical protein